MNTYICGHKLKETGAGKVYPFALASISKG